MQSVGFSSAGLPPAIMNRLLKNTGTGVLLTHPPVKNDLAFITNIEHCNEILKKCLKPENTELRAKYFGENAKTPEDVGRKLKEIYA